MVVFVFILGLSIGSFLNVLADRLPRDEDVLTSRSHCDYCKHTLRWYELIPLVSFLFQRGQTGCCHKKLSWRYPLSELITGIGFVSIYLSQPFQSPTLASVVDPMIFAQFLVNVTIFSSLMVVCITDFDHEIIPMEMIVIGGIAAVAQVLLEYFKLFPFVSPTSLLSFSTSIIFLSHCIPGFVVGIFFFCLWFFSKGKAMGDGDIYLAFLLAFLVGYPLVFVFFYAAFLTGAVVGVILILGRKKSLKTHIPFGPFLIWGYFVALIWGVRIIGMWRFL